MMPAPFSEDLRWQVIWFVHVLQHSVADASFFLGVSERTVEHHISKFLVTGDVNCYKGGRTSNVWRQNMSRSRESLITQVTETADTNTLRATHACEL